MNIYTSKARQQLILEIEKIFENDNRIHIDGEISYSHLVDYAKKLDEDVIMKLLNNNTTKEIFFKIVAGNYNFIFDTFEKFINSQIIDNSYTSFANRIGLTVDNRFIKDSKDVVLNFPYKDCYLQGGQSTEEGIETYYTEKDGKLKEHTRKRKEIFFNQYIAYDEIDLLLIKKAFTNFKHYKKDGIKKVKAFNRDEEGVIKDNLVIKGNNLLALHSIKKEFKGKVKLIYIDPPYNTGNDGFKYNDNFNHSTWLVFMKNRLEVARELLRDDGVIFIQCDDNEQAYLKVLMDEIFGRENSDTIIWKKIEDNTSSGGTMKITNTFRIDHEYILIYYINKKRFRTKKYYELPSFANDYSNFDNDPRGEYKAGSISMKGTKKSSKYYEIITPSGRKIKRVWRITYDEYMKLDKDNRIYYGKNGGSVPQLKIFLNEERKVTPKSIFENLGSAFKAREYLESIIVKNNFSTVKPEELLERILYTCTKEKDIILDFVSGSGTTAAVAHKMNRQYIAIEQMDYIENITVERLKKVIEGEQGGISKAADWNGGGDFIYFELAKYNKIAQDKIQNTKDWEELKNLFDDLCNNYFLRYNVNIKDLEEKHLNSECFIDLEFKKKKEVFLNLLDPNQLYINFDNMEDSRYKLSEEDKKLTREFYNLQ